MIKNYHEAPIALMPLVSQYTYGDYALAHFLETIPEYAEYFLQHTHRPIILDNSIYEGQAAPDTVYIKWIQTLKPLYYIVPDVMGDFEQNIKTFLCWIYTYYDLLPDARMGVLHFSSEYEFIYSYLCMRASCKCIAIPFHNPTWDNLEVDLRGWARYELLHKMCKDGVIREGTNIHLLGCYTPQEVKLYQGSKVTDYISLSIDTSNPVMAGLEGKRYTDSGLERKPTMNIKDVILESVHHLEEVKYNLRKFHEWCN